MILDCSAPGQYQVLVDEIHDFSAPISELRLPLKHTSPIFTLSLKDEQYIKGKSMSLQTNLKGRLRNTFLPKNHGLMPVFEAVVNSIQSIEEKGDIDSGKIVLSIDRATQGGLDLESRSIPPIIGFSISDNGCGFDNNNFKSFETLDSDHKIQKGCRGVGRCLSCRDVTVSSLLQQLLIASTQYNLSSYKDSCCFSVSPMHHPVQRR